MGRLVSPYSPDLEMARREVKNTVRFLVKPVFLREVGLREVVVDALCGALKVEVSEIFALQDFPATGTYDITFCSEKKCLEVYENANLKKLEGHYLLQKFIFELQFDPEVKYVTVHLYNPFLETSLVRTFLMRYCYDVGPGQKLKNTYGIYRSKVKFKVRFEKDSKGYGGFKHPPAIFTIAGQRCSCFYIGQPQFCRQCHQYGHVKEECGAGVCCRLCGEPGHQAAQCPKPATCDLCAKEGHKTKDCPLTRGAKVFTYADAAKKNTPSEEKFVFTKHPVKIITRRKAASQAEDEEEPAEEGEEVQDPSDSGERAVQEENREEQVVMPGPSGDVEGRTLGVVAAGEEVEAKVKEYVPNMEVEEGDQEEEESKMEEGGEGTSLPERPPTAAQKSAVREESDEEYANKRSRTECLPDSPYSTDLMISSDLAVSDSEESEKETFQRKDLGGGGDGSAIT